METVLGPGDHSAPVRSQEGGKPRREVCKAIQASLGAGVVSSSRGPGGQNALHGDPWNPGSPAFLLLGELTRLCVFLVAVDFNQVERRRERALA